MNHFRYGALLHILAFTPLRRHTRQQQEDSERQRVLEALHPDPDYDDPEPETDAAVLNPAHAPKSGRPHAKNSASRISDVSAGVEHGDDFQPVVGTKKLSKLERKESHGDTENDPSASRGSRWQHRYQKRKETAPKELPRYLAPSSRRPVDLYDTFRMNTLRHRGSLHAHYRDICRTPQLSFVVATEIDRPTD